MNAFDSELFRPALFVGLLTFFLMLEHFFPKRQFKHSRLRRIATNVSLSFINSMLIIALFKMSLVAWSQHLENSRLSLVKLSDLSTPVAFLVSVVILDFAIYLQHVLSHRIPFLWRLHLVHHADVELDASSGSRFHFLEMILSFLYKMAVIFVIGAPAGAVLAFEVILSSMALFNHANLRLPVVFDAFVRSVFVTPDMHRVHHSTVLQEHNSNFGFNLSVWDRVFRTYRKEPADGHLDMKIGLNEFREEKYINPLMILAMPWMRGQSCESSDL